MIGQSLYYLNNKKYITNTHNVETVIGELNSFYHTAQPRRITIVNPSMENSRLEPAEYENLAENARTGASELMDFAAWEDVANATYIQNSDKRIVMFTDETDMLFVFANYTAGLLRASGFYPEPANDINAITAHYIDAVINQDMVLSMMSDSQVYADARNHVLGVLNAEDAVPWVVTYQNGKNFSYDLLFFLNDTYPSAEIAGLLVEKFTIHSPVMAKDVMEHFTSRRHYSAYIMSVIDYMNANATDANGWATDKKQFFKDVYINAANKSNYTLAFYLLEELWNKVKDDADFIAVHQNKADTTPDGWEYMDLYTEINNVFPIVKKVLERNFDAANITEDLRLINTDVQFFSKRQNRIPYLIHKYPLI